jgi:hypothetical protein
MCLRRAGFGQIIPSRGTILFLEFLATKWEYWADEYFDLKIKKSMRLQGFLE